MKRRSKNSSLHFFFTLPPSAAFRWLYQYIQHNLDDFDEFATYVDANLAQREGPDEDASY